MSAGGDSARVIVIALFANLGIAVAKFVGFVISGSASMLAEAIHSLVDSTNQVLLLLGSRQSLKPVTPRYPLGRGRETFFWSFIVAILLFSLGGLFAIYEGVHKLSDHSDLKAPHIALIILLVSIVLEGYSFWACVKSVRAVKREMGWWDWLRRTSSVELLVIFTEDLAALSGLVLATLFLLLAWYTGNPTWDAMGSIVVGGVLVTVAVFLAVEIKSMLVGEAPDVDFRSFLQEKLEKRFPGSKIFNLIALNIGSDEVLLSCKFSPGEVREACALMEGINAVESEMKGLFPQIRWQFFEPDYAD